MGSKKGKSVRKIEVPTDTPTHFELGDTAADIQRREEKEQRDSMRSDITIQPSVTNPSSVSQCSTVDEQVMKQKTVLSSFLGRRQESTRTAFCNYLASEDEVLEDRDFQTFRNVAMKLLSGSQSRAEERTCQPQQPQQPTLSRMSSATYTYVPQTFQ